MAKLIVLLLQTFQFYYELIMTIFPSAYAPFVSYYVMLLHSTDVCIEMYETFPKQTIRNRCVIAGANGPLRLTVPLSNRRNNTLIKEVEISYQTKWQIQHWRSIESAYNTSPFFEFYADDFKLIYETEFQFLWQWNEAMFNLINKLLKVDISYSFTEEFLSKSHVENDFRSYDFIQNSDLIKIKYHQVFEDKLGFISNLSILDLLFNCGNKSRDILFF